METTYTVTWIEWHATEGIWEERAEFHCTLEAAIESRDSLARGPFALDVEINGGRQ